MELTDVKIEELAPCVIRMHAQAPGISMLYFGQPVYLVGKSLYSCTDPRDIDVVVILPDDLFVAAYGDKERHQTDGIKNAITQWMVDNSKTISPTKLWLRWARDMAKQNAFLTRVCDRRVDFKVQPQSYAQAMYEHKPRFQLFEGFV